jgi:hypothetical protein
MIITLRPLELVACDARRTVPPHVARAERAVERVLGDPPWYAGEQARALSVTVAAQRLGVIDMRYDVARPPRADWLVLVDELTPDSFGFAGCCTGAEFVAQSVILNDGEPYRWLSRFDLSPFKRLIDELSPIVIPFADGEARQTGT